MSKVKAILVNIFGGIVNCATIANGITNAGKKMNLQVPLIVRLQGDSYFLFSSIKVILSILILLLGTNMDKGNEIIRNSGLKIISAPDLDDAAKKACSSI